MDVKIRELIKQYSNVSESALDKMALAAEYLKQESKKFNLTSLKTDEDIAMLHFVDSLTFFESGVVKGNDSVIDIGCGAGFPSLVIAAADEKLSVTAVDSTAKKAEYVGRCAEYAGINNIKTVSGRAEELALDRAYRDRFDIATARSVASLNVLCELCLPFVKKGGHFVALKGSKGYEEYVDAKKAITSLGAEFVTINETKIPLADHTHTVIVIRKMSNTPDKYPRPYAKIIKKPL